MTNEKDAFSVRWLRVGVSLQQFLEKTAETLKPFMNAGASLEIHNMTLFYSNDHELCVDTKEELPKLTLKLPNR